MGTYFRIQPKQWEILNLILHGQADWIGVGGGRGCAKSFALDLILIYLAQTPRPKRMCIVMRNYDQVRRYHIEEMMRNWPELTETLHKTDSHLIVGSSQIDFSYAENHADVERRFRSANYDIVAVDQAEQFLPEELREMKKSCRIGFAKMLLSFNMGGIGIQGLRKWFHTREYNERESASNYAFVHVYPWDNVFWSKDALAADGLTEEDYYQWTDEARMNYCATRSNFGRSLNADDDALRNRDWLSSWDSLEGAYFGRVFDRESMLITTQQANDLIKPWDQRWLSMDWGKTHYCSTHWHAKTNVSTDEALSILGWKCEKPFRAVVTYREAIVNEMSSPDVAKMLVAKTPVHERAQLLKFWLSPDAFGERDSSNTIADNLSRELRRNDLPVPGQADDDRVGGWQLMHNLLLETKRHGLAGGDVWLATGSCPELMAALPIAMSDPKNLDDVLKTDKGHARIDQDVLDDVRYGMKSMLSPGVKPKRVVLDEQLSQQTGQARLHTLLTFEAKWKAQHPGIQRTRRYQ